MSRLFEPLAVGALALPNRIVMAPMTRNRSSGVGRVPNAMMREYYTQRAQAGLIISEATAVSQAASGTHGHLASGAQSKSMGGVRSSRAYTPPAGGCSCSSGMRVGCPTRSITTARSP